MTRCATSEPAQQRLRAALELIEGTSAKFWHDGFSVNPHHFESVKYLYTACKSSFVGRDSGQDDLESVRDDYRKANTAVDSHVY
jgi:hypothetical protein